MSRKPYIKPLPKATWYFNKPQHLLHMLNEISSFFIGLYALLLLWGVQSIACGPEAYQTFLLTLSHPFAIGFHLIALPLTLYHASFWFTSAPKAMPIEIGDKRLPDSIIVMTQYGIMVAFSILILFLTGVF